MLSIKLFDILFLIISIKYYGVKEKEKLFSFFLFNKKL